MVLLDSELSPLWHYKEREFSLPLLRLEPRLGRSIVTILTGLSQLLSLTHIWRTSETNTPCIHQIVTLKWMLSEFLYVIDKREASKKICLKVRVKGRMKVLRIGGMMKSNVPVSGIGCRYMNSIYLSQYYVSWRWLIIFKNNNYKKGLTKTLLSLRNFNFRRWLA
jgi:hypothetical protein